MKKAALYAVTVVALSVLNQTAVSATNAISVEIKWGDSTFRLPIVAQSLFNFEKAADLGIFRDGSSSRPAQIRIRAEIEELLEEGYDLESVTFPFGSACEDAFISSPICAFTRNSSSEPYTIYDLQVRPMTAIMQTVIASSGGAWALPERGRSAIVAKLNFQGDVWRFIHPRAGIGSYNFMIDGAFFAPLEYSLTANQVKQKQL